MPNLAIIRLLLTILSADFGKIIAQNNSSKVSHTSFYNCPAFFLRYDYNMKLCMGINLKQRNVYRFLLDTPFIY